MNQKLASKQQTETTASLQINGKTYHYHSMQQTAEKMQFHNWQQLPFSLKVLFENQIRHFDDSTVTQTDLNAFQTWLNEAHCAHEIAYRPARVLMQDFTGVPAIVDLAAMRDATVAMGNDPKTINPQCAVDLVIDHSVQVDNYTGRNAFDLNVKLEMQRNFERYQFLKWGQTAFDNFRVVPPGTGICHQVNLENLAQVIWTQTDSQNNTLAYPDTLVGTDSHTTMINGLGVLGWGVGGIEAEAAMLGQPISMLIPDVIGVKLTGHLNPGVTATDLVLTITEILRRQDVVGKFVEFVGAGLAHLSLADRATIANMAPEYGATCGFFPVDNETLAYLRQTARDPQNIELVKAYCKAQGLWHDSSQPEPIYTQTVEVDLASVVPSVAGPKRPQDRVAVNALRGTMESLITERHTEEDNPLNATFSSDLGQHQHGHVFIAAITSCTNTSNPSVMLAAGLLAKKAAALGLKAKPWVKTSLAPGSKVVTDYLEAAGLLSELEAINFFMVGYGCTTCIGNSGPLPDPINSVIDDNDLYSCAVLSGNRNFEGRIHAKIRASWLASPPLVVAYALAGTMKINLDQEPLATTDDGKPVYLKDIWPSQEEIQTALNVINQSMFAKQYSNVFSGDDSWKSIETPTSNTYDWSDGSTYVRHPTFFDNMPKQPAALQSITGARVLALLGDTITTDHISPAGSIAPDSPAGQYLQQHQVQAADFNSFGSRRGNHEVMMRGTFGNVRLRNEMAPGTEGSWTKQHPAGDIVQIYDAAMAYQAENTPLVIVAGKLYGQGSSRDWAAKGTLLLGVKAVIAESFERIHRSNLIGMGVLPLQFQPGNNRHTLSLDGSEQFDISIDDKLAPQSTVAATITRRSGEKIHINLLCRIDTGNELAYYCHGGILQYVLRQQA